MAAKHDYMQNFGVENDADIARTLAMFGGFTEGLQLFASFAMLMNFPRFNFAGTRRPPRYWQLGEEVQ